MEKNICIRTTSNAIQIETCKNTISEFDKSFTLLSNALNLAGNPVRLKILFLLSKEHQLCVCDLSDILNMNISAVSQHLRKLRDRNLIYSSRSAQTIYYNISPEYKIIFSPFFNLIDDNKILKAV